MIKCPLVKTHLNKCHKYNCGVSILFLSICCVVCVCGGGGGAAFGGPWERGLGGGGGGGGGGLHLRALASVVWTGV